MARIVEMDVMSELASDITEYIITSFTNAPLEFEDENGDIRYHEMAQEDQYPNFNKQMFIEGCTINEDDDLAGTLTNKFGL